MRTCLPARQLKPDDPGDVWHMSPAHETRCLALGNRPIIYTNLRDDMRDPPIDAGDGIQQRERFLLRL
jgi:hypothetical protein